MKKKPTVSPKKERNKADTEKYNKYGIKIGEDEESNTIRDKSKGTKKGETIASSTELKIKSGTIKKKKDELVIKPQDINKTITIKKSVLQKLEQAQKDKNIVVVRFSIYYSTHYGETLYIVGSIPKLGDWEIQEALQMEYCSDIWEAEALLPGNMDIEYKYVVVQAQQLPLWEAGANRKVFINPEIAANRCVELRDVWQNPELIYHSDQQQSCMLKRIPPRFDISNGILLCFQLHAANLNLVEGDAIHIIGSTSYLGDWDPLKAPSLQPLQKRMSNWWAQAIPVADNHLAFEYKYIIKHLDGRPVTWESGENRNLAIDNSFDNSAKPMLIVFCNDRVFRISHQNLSQLSISL